MGDWRMEVCTMYVTNEPCAMCSGALVNARMKRLCFGVRDGRCGGGGSSTLNVCNYPGMLWQVEVQGGILEKECLQIIQDFFAEVRRKKKLKF
ncbi:MAG: deaminase [Victivallaceae bacterium]